MRHILVGVALAGATTLSACGSSTTTALPPKPHATEVSSAPPGHSQARLLVKRIAAKAVRVRSDLENLYYDMAGVSAGGVDAAGFVNEFPQLIRANLDPDSLALAKALIGTVRTPASPDARAELAFAEAVGRLERVISTGNAMWDATAQSSGSASTQAVATFEQALDSTRTSWNEAVTALWRNAGISGAPIVSADCAPNDKSACASPTH